MSDKQLWILLTVPFNCSTEINIHNNNLTSKMAWVGV